MTADIDGQDPKSLWRRQELERDRVTLEQVHDLARKVDRRTRFTPAVMALGLVLAGFLTAELWTSAHNSLQRASAILFIVGQLGCCVVIYRTVFPEHDPAAPVSAHLRRRLQLLLSYQRGGWAIVLLPLLPFLLVGGYASLQNADGALWVRFAPIVLLAAALALFVVRVRAGARRVRVQLQELDALLRR